EDVVEHAIEPAPLEPVLGDDARMLERAPERGAQRSVHAHLAAHLRLLEDLQAAVQRQLAHPVLSPAAQKEASMNSRWWGAELMMSSDAEHFDAVTVDAHLHHIERRQPVRPYRRPLRCKGAVVARANQGVLS